MNLCDYKRDYVTGPVPGIEQPRLIVWWYSCRYPWSSGQNSLESHIQGSSNTGESCPIAELWDSARQEAKQLRRSGSLSAFVTSGTSQQVAY